jgi:hypothetical protein
MFTLKFSTDNAAFADDMHGEAARILRACADQLDRGKLAAVIRDINGNRCGTWSIVDGETSE